LGVSQRQTYGLIINPVISVNRISDNYTNQVSPSIGNAGINFILPLLKGWGKPVNTAPEESAKMAREAAIYNYSYTLTASITRTVVSYWNYLGAKKMLDVTQIAEERSQSLLDNAHKLVQGENIPASDIIKYETKLAAAISNRITANQNMIGARGLLLNAMNITDDMEGGFIPPEDSFPEPEQANLELLNDTATVANLITETKNRRFDVMAADYSRQSTEILATAAHIDNKSRLDLMINVGYSSLANGNSAVEPYLAFNNWASGPNAGVTLNYAIPVTSSANRGQVLQTAAVAEQSKIQLEALNNSVTNDARVQINNLRAVLIVLEQAHKQLDLQTIVYGNEKKKYSAGISTIIDLFTQESLLTSNQGSLVAAQTAFANALIQVRFYSGTLLTHNQDGQSLNKNQLTTLPSPSALMTH
jgi:outer membrane protein TolC